MPPPQTAGGRGADDGDKGGGGEGGTKKRKKRTQSYKRGGKRPRTHNHREAERRMCDGGECGASSGPWFLTGRPQG